MTLAQQPALVAERYRLLEPLGSGGMGRVWLARDEVLRRDVAIKEIVPPEGLTEAEREELQRRTMREARAAARLNNPHVVRIYDVVQTEMRPWIVMEYVPSRSLHQVITEDGPLPPDRAAAIGIDVLAALKAAHLAGVLHRDVKPGNVLLADDGRVVLTDFGLAIFEGGDGAVTRPGLILGSPQYISPERAREGISGAEADLWSLGATLYAAVEGRSPYARSTTFATLTALATEDPDPAHRAGVLKPVLNALLRKDPRARAGVAETERLLRRAANGEGRVWPWALPRQRKSREIISGGVVRSVGGSGPDSGLAAAVSSVSAAPSKAPPPVDAESMARVNENDSESVSQIGTTNARPNVTFPGKARGKATVPGIPTSPAPAGHAVPPVGGWGSTPPAAPSRPRRRRRLLVGLAAVVVLGLLAGLLLVYDRKPTRPTAGAPSSPSAVSPSPSQSEQFGLLPGFSYYTDPTYKWRIAKPNGWTPRTDPAQPTMIFFDEPVLPHRTLGVDRITAPNTDPVAALKAEATTRSTDGTMPGYKQVRIDPVPGLFKGAADWVYSYNTADGRMQVCERGLVISNQLGYSIYWATPADQWKQNADNWNMISISFTPEPTAS